MHPALRFAALTSPLLLNTLAYGWQLSPTGPPWPSTVQFIRWGWSSLDSLSATNSRNRACLCTAPLKSLTDAQTRPLDERIGLHQMHLQWPFLCSLIRFPEGTAEGIDFGPLMAARIFVWGRTLQGREPAVAIKEQSNAEPKAHTLMARDQHNGGHQHLMTGTALTIGAGRAAQFQKQRGDSPG